MGSPTSKKPKSRIGFNTDISRLHFVPDALPDLNLKDIDVLREERIGGAHLKCLPVAVETDDEAKAVEFSVSTGHPIFYLTGKSELLAIIEGKVASRAKIRKARRVSNGLELAKCIRLGIAPCTIDSVQQIDQIAEQLRIAMFLTNSRDMQSLKKAEVYVV